MFCITCGADNVESSAHCIRCGQDLVTLRIDKYSTPFSPASSATLWNPDVAALLSMPFSPIFGAIIHALNWQRLGQSRRALVAWSWGTFILLAFIGVTFYGAVAHLSAHTIHAYLRLTQIVALPLWYFATARAQGKFIGLKLKGEYLRESWFIPVAVATILVGALYGLSGTLQQ